jgi:hypothetical protein
MAVDSLPYRVLGSVCRSAARCTDKRTLFLPVGCGRHGPTDGRESPVAQLACSRCVEMGGARQARVC